MPIRKEKVKILAMLDSGKITEEEAGRLLVALRKSYGSRGMRFRLQRSRPDFFLSFELMRRRMRQRATRQGLLLSRMKTETY